MKPRLSYVYIYLVDDEIHKKGGEFTKYVHTRRYPPEDVFKSFVKMLYLKYIII